MNTITVDRFIQHLQSATIETEHELDPYKDWDHKSDGSSLCTGWIWNTLTVPGVIKIVYQNYFKYPENKPSLVETYHDVPEQWEPARLDVQVVDEDGDALSLYEIGDIILDHTAIDNFDLSVLGEDNHNN